MDQADLLCDQGTHTVQQEADTAIATPEISPNLEPFTWQGVLADTM
jgi:hypothetical protein